MTQVTLYHNPRCSKSREALALLEAQGIQPKVVLYLETPSKPKELESLLKQLGLKPKDVMRTKEPVYRELKLAQSQLTDKQLIQILADNPILIERPIVVCKQKAVIARPPEKLLEII